MKTISVRQPWAYLICSGFKDVENRSRRILYRGKILIHAPIRFDNREDNCLTLKQAEYVITESGWGERFFDKDFVFSAIIGSIEIVDCINDSESIWAEPGQWHWILKNPVLFDKPILNVKGKLGLWNYEGELQENGIIRFSNYVNLDDNPVKRTPLDYPYSYDMYVTYKNGQKEDITGSRYSDRLLQWDYKLTRDLMQKHFGESGDIYSDREPEKIEKFLRERLNEPNLRLIAIQQECNVSNGFPVWWFGYKV